MASLAKSKNGRYWRFRFYNSQRSPKNKEILRATIEHDPEYGLTVREAENLLANMEADYRAGWDPWYSHDIAPTESESLPLVDICSQALTHWEGSIAPSSLQTRTDHLTLLKREFGEKIPFSMINEYRLNAYINSSGSYSYKMRRKSVISLLYKFAYREFGIPQPKLEVVASRSERNSFYNKDFKTFLIREELEYMLSNISEIRSRHRHNRELLADFYRLAFLTGRRRSDLLAIKGEWISMRNPIMELYDDDYITKGMRFEFIPLSTEAWEILKRRKKPGLIFDGYHKNFVTKEFKKIARNTLEYKSEKLSLHKLRDSAIMDMLYRQGLDTKDVMARVGHASLRSLDKYVHAGGEQIVDLLVERFEDWKKEREASEEASA